MLEAETALGRLQLQAEEAEQQIRQAEGRTETAQSAPKELELKKEEAARIRNEAPFEVRPCLAAMLVPEQMQYKMSGSRDWFCITAGTELVCHLEPLCSHDIALTWLWSQPIGRTYSRIRLNVSGDLPAPEHVP